MDFDTLFLELTGNAPFPWQRALYRRFLGDEGGIPDACIIPTGLGKTMTLAVWLLALAEDATKVPRRLVYVVNRRTVVDQSTTEAVKLRYRLATNDNLAGVRARLNELCALTNHKHPLAISTLRGQFADNEEWRTDPARPAIICGTVDMIGSRLLFSGYRIGYKSRPLHAGFLGCDSLLVHDEAHLEPAFQDLLDAILAEQGRSGDAKPLRLVELTATTRREGGRILRLSPDDERHPTVRERYNADKTVHLAEATDDGLVGAIVERAEAHEKSGQAILIFAQTVKSVNAIVACLKNAQPLTGTMRGYERDRLVSQNAIFARFLPPADRNPKVEAKKGTVYLVCTSAGEVGVNISADHLVCDLSPFDSMAQRFGRVNRFGNGKARIDVVYPAEFGKDELESRRQRTLALLQQLPDKCASPAALSGLDEAARRNAFTPRPDAPPVTDILFDAWSMTTLRGRQPGCPPVADWLRGIPNKWEPLRTQVAWRREVGMLTEDWIGSQVTPEEVLEEYPLKTLEILNDATPRVHEQFKKLAKRVPDHYAWLVSEDGKVRWVTIADLAATKPDVMNVELGGKTIILQPETGGLEGGLLRGESKHDQEACCYDVADEWRDEHCRRWRFRPSVGTKLREARARLNKDNPPTPEEFEEGVEWRWEEVLTVLVAQDEESDEAKPDLYWLERSLRPRIQKAEELLPHLDSVARAAKLIATKLEPELLDVFVFSGQKHDLGKSRRIWQRSIANFGEVLLAKPKGDPVGKIRTSYRHEFGSLLDLMGCSDLAEMADGDRELVLHVVATHHGRGRPHFPEDQAFDPHWSDDEARELAQAVPLRFARLQRKYGRWRLAYLESILRAADYLASEGKS